MGYIYKITNDVNGKMYIGKTELTDPYKRWERHIKDSKRNEHKERPLYRAINKYGIEHFCFEVIEETNETCIREQYWIKKLRTYVGFEDCNGYNATLGGDGARYIEIDENEIVKYHIEEGCYMMNKTTKHFKISRCALKRILEKHHIPWLTRKHCLQLKNYIYHGAIYQIDVNNKMIIDTYECATTVMNLDGRSVKATTISNACNGEHEHYAYGYRWYYGKDLNDAIENGHLLNINHSWI